VRARPLIAIAAMAVALGGCGSAEEPEPVVPRERADRPAPLPAGWARVVNARAGFSLGLPPGWAARGTGGTTVIRSADGGLAVSVTADRSLDGRTLSLVTYARRTARSLPGYAGLRPGRARTLRGARYPAVSVSTAGRFRRTGVRQAIRVIAMRRPRQVTFTLVFFRNARTDARVYAEAGAVMVRSLRGRPPVF